MTKAGKILFTVAVTALILGALCILAGIITGGDFERVKNVFYAVHDVENRLHVFRTLFTYGQYAQRRTATGYDRPKQGNTSCSGRFFLCCSGRGRIKRRFLPAVAEYTESAGFRSENSISAPFSIIVSFDIIIKIKICAAAAAKTI